MALNGAGRPSLGNAARRRAVTVRFTDAEFAEFQRAADLEVLSLSDYLRAAAELAIARGSTR